MTDSKFEKTLAYFCSPVLLNRKVSNLVSVSKNEITNIDLIIRHYNKIFKEYDLKMESICECGGRILVFVYKRSQLFSYLKSKGVNEKLNEMGYLHLETLDEYIEMLREKIKNDGFPHEIGFFLGYPIKDVIGFIENNGRDYKYCGYWKVYSDLKRAKAMFTLYDSLREFIMKKINLGDSLENILITFQKEASNIA